MQPFANLLEDLHALGGEEADSYAVEFALNRAENCDDKDFWLVHKPRDAI